MKKKNEKKVNEEVLVHELLHKYDLLSTKHRADFIVFLDALIKAQCAHAQNLNSPE